MTQMTPSQIQALHDVFGYDVVVKGVFGGVFMGDTFLYMVELI